MKAKKTYFSDRFGLGDLAVSRPAAIILRERKLRTFSPEKFIGWSKMSEGKEPSLYTTVSTSLVATSSSFKEPAGRPFITEKGTFPAMTGREKEGRDNLRTRLVTALSRIGASKRESLLTFNQISRSHGRAIVESGSSRQVIWGDKYGHVYGARDFKGTVMDENSLVVEPDGGYLPDGSVSHYRVRGLRDKSAFAWDEVASRVFRQNGLPTEVPVRVEQLKQVLVQGETVPIEIWRRQKIAELKEQARQARQEGTASANFRVYEATKKIEYLTGSEFFAIERDLQVAERLEDILMINSWAEAKKLLWPTVKWLRVAGEVRHQGLISGTPLPPEVLFKGLTKTDSQSGELKEDLRRYFGSWLPEQMGTYLGRLHKLGIIHGFPHGQNWSLVGSLYDLDSCWGVPFGDKPPEPQDYQEDVGYAEGGIIDVMMNGRLFLAVAPELYKEALAHFISAYIKERRGLGIDFTRVQKAFFEKNLAFRKTPKAKREKFSFPSQEVWPQVEELFAQAKASVNK